MLFLSFSKKCSEFLTDDPTWTADVVLERYADLQGPVLGLIVKQHLISRAIVLLLNT